MAFGYVIGGGGGSALNANVGSTSQPVYINSSGEPEACTRIDLPVEGVATKANAVKINDATTASGTFYLVLAPSLDYQAESISTNLMYNPSDDILYVSYIEGLISKAESLYLDSAVGEPTRPIYFNADGQPVKCNDLLDNSISGIAASANKLNTDKGSATKPIYFNNGVPVQCNDTLDNNISGSATKLTSNGGSATKPIYFNNGVPAVCSDTLGVSITGTAKAATQLTSQAGSATKPIYFNNGVPAVCNDLLGNSISGNAATVTWTKGDSTTAFKVGGVAPSSGNAYYNSSVEITTANVLKGAAWNDYAEFRQANAKPGQVVVPGISCLIPSQKRLQKAGKIVSDTYGFIIGDETDLSKAIAVAGRVLAYADNKSKLSVGDAVCTGKDGTVSKMNRLEIILFPDRIIGYVDEIPTVDTWHNIKINNRIWIKVN